MKSTAELIKDLQAFIKAGDRQAMSKFLTNPAITKEVLDGQGENGDTPLITAVLSGNRYMVTLLLIAGAGIDVKNNKNESALRVAAGILRNLEITRILKEAGPSWADMTGSKLLNYLQGDIFTVANSLPEILRKEAEKAANTYLTDNSAHELDMRLLNACKTHDEKKIKELLTEGADPNRYSTKENGGYAYYPLHHAIGKNVSEPVLKELMSHGAYPKNSGAPMTIPPLYLASISGMYIANTLIESGADINAKISGGELDGAVVLHGSFSDTRGLFVGHVDTIKLLLKNKASVTDRRKSDGKTPLQAAINVWAWNVLLGVLDRVVPTYPDIGINEPDNEGVTPAMMLAQTTGSEIRPYVSRIDQFIKLPRIDLSLADNKGNTALHHAVISGNVAVLEALCKVREPNNAYPKFMNARNKNGYTALDLACIKHFENHDANKKRDYQAIILQLMGNGADANAWAMYDKNEKATPLIYALKRNTTFSDTNNTLTSLYGETVDTEKVVATLKAAIGFKGDDKNKMINFIIATIMEKRGFNFTAASNEDGILYFELLNLAVENANHYAIKQLIAAGEGMGEYPNKERALLVAISKRYPKETVYATAWDEYQEVIEFLLSIGANPFQRIAVPGENDKTISACAWSAKRYDKKMVALMMYSHLIRLPYVFTPDEVFYIEHMEKTIHSELPVFLTYDDPARTYQDDILKLILKHVVELVRQQKDAQSKFAILNKVTGYEPAYSETVLSKFLRESGNEYVISSLRKELALVRAKATAASLPAYSDTESAQDQADEFISKPTPSASSSSVPLIPMDVLPKTAIAPDPEPVTTSQPATVVAPPATQDVLFLKTLRLLEEKHQQEMAALRAEFESRPQEHQQALADKDREIAGLQEQLKTQNAVVRAQSIQIARFQAHYVAQGMLNETLMFSNSEGNDGARSGASLRGGMLRRIF